jgi:hypothetical protein
MLAAPSICIFLSRLLRKIERVDKAMDTSHMDCPFLQSSLLCEGVTTDKEGRHTFHNEFTQYTMGYSTEFCVVNMWRGNKDKPESQYVEKVEIVAPDGKVIAAGEAGPFALQDDSYRQLNSITMDGVDFTHSGQYEIKINLNENGKTVFTLEYPFLVS